MFDMLRLGKSWLRPIPILSNVTSKRANRSEIGEGHHEVSPKINILRQFWCQGDNLNPCRRKEEKSETSPKQEKGFEKSDFKSAPSRLAFTTFCQRWRNE